MDDPAQTNQVDMLLDWLSDGTGPPTQPADLTSDELDSTLMPLQGAEDLMMATDEFQSAPFYSSPVVFHRSSIGVDPPADSCALAPPLFQPTPLNPVLIQVHSLISAQRSTLERLRRAQRDAVTSPPTNALLATLQTLAQQQAVVSEEIGRVSVALQGLRSQQLLSANEIHFCQSLTDTLGVHALQLALFRSELEYLSCKFDQFSPVRQEAPAPSALVGIALLRTPFPSIWMKRNQLPDSENIQIQLLTAPGVQLLEVAAVKAHVICFNHASKNPKPFFEIDAVPIDPSTLSATFNLTFLAGTRKDVAQLRFTVQLRFALAHGGVLSSSYTVEASSTDSSPFIVLTNESQFSTAINTLFHRDLFHFYWAKSVSCVPWLLFANFLQSYFVKATRQSSDSPSRPLSPVDLLYIHSQFFKSEAQVEIQQSEKFWLWFGVVLQKLRYQRHWISLWCAGLIYGFMSRETVLQHLTSTPVGSFLLRFSETSAGSISIGFRVPGNVIVKNYLVKHEDIAGSNKSLPDFLLARPEFQILLQYLGFVPTSHNLEFQLVSKQVLQRFSIPKLSKATSLVSPYDDL